MPFSVRARPAVTHDIYAWFTEEWLYSGCAEDMVIWCNTV